MNPWIFILHVLELLSDVLDKTAERAGVLLADLWHSFPNVFAMADDISRFCTGAIGIIVDSITTQDIRVMGRLFHQRYHSKLLTPRAMFKFMEYAVGNFATVVTLTNEQGVIAWAAQRFAVGTWHMIKRWKLLLAVLKISSFEDVRIIVNGMLKYRAALAVALFVLLLVYWFVAVTALVLPLILHFYIDDFGTFVLAQDAKRERSKQAHPRMRQNVRAGPDFSAASLPRKTRPNRSRNSPCKEKAVRPKTAQTDLAISERT